MSQMAKLQFFENWREYYFAKFIYDVYAYIRFFVKSICIDKIFVLTLFNSGRRALHLGEEFEWSAWPWQK